MHVADQSDFPLKILLHILRLILQHIFSVNDGSERSGKSLSAKKVSIWGCFDTLGGCSATHAVEYYEMRCYIWYSYTVQNALSGSVCISVTGQ